MMSVQTPNNAIHFLCYFRDSAHSIYGDPHMATKRRTSSKKGSLTSKTKRGLGKTTSKTRRRRSRTLETTW
jgi:hypothetical protein